MRYGVKIITGVRNGDLEYRENGAWKPLNTDAMPEEEWRAILSRDFFELIDFVAAKAFNPVSDADSAGEGEEKKL